MVLLAHVSDLHLDGGERAAARAKRVLAFLDGLACPVDAVLLTGDIADHGTEAEQGNRSGRRIAALLGAVIGQQGEGELLGQPGLVAVGRPALLHDQHRV